MSVDPATTSTWRGSVDNGDKPGIGIELTVHAGSLTGRLFLLEPDRPHVFSRGSPRRMQIRVATDTEIRFAVDWLPDVHDEMILRLNSPLQGERVRGILESVDGPGQPREYEFVRSK